MLKKLFGLNKLVIRPFINLNYDLKPKHNMYDKGEKATPYVENVVETVERFNKNIGDYAKNTVKNDEIINIHQNHQDNSFGNQKTDFAAKGEDYNFDKEIIISKNKFYDDEKTNAHSEKSYFFSDEKEEIEDKQQNQDIIEKLSDNLEFLSRRGVYIDK